MNAEVPNCIDCGKPAPPTDTNYTLISARHGWRLVISKGQDGRRSSAWRCPDCWMKHKSRGGAG